MPLLLECDKTRYAPQTPPIQPAEVSGTGQEGRVGEVSPRIKRMETGWRSKTILAVTSMIVMMPTRRWSRTVARVAPITASLGCGRHRSRLARCHQQTPDEEAPSDEIGPLPSCSCQGVRPLPHKNRGRGGWITGNPRRGSGGVARGLLHQPRA